MANPKAVQFLEAVYSRVDRQVRDVITSMLRDPTIGVQDEGTVVANRWNIVNFIGPGVTVTEDAALRRVNVYIPGAPIVASTTTVVSSTSAKARSLWSSGSNSAPPAGWNQPSYNDSTWSAAVVASTSSGSDAVAGSSPIWATASPAALTEEVLLRHTFALPSGTISQATLQVSVDGSYAGIWLNGSIIPGSDGFANLITGATHTFSLSPSQFTPGANNLLACDVLNSGSGTSGCGNGSFTDVVNVGGYGRYYGPHTLQANLTATDFQMSGNYSSSAVPNHATINFDWYDASNNVITRDVNLSIPPQTGPITYHLPTFQSYVSAGARSVGWEVFQDGSSPWNPFSVTFNWNYTFSGCTNPDHAMASYKLIVAYVGT